MVLVISVCYIIDLTDSRKNNTNGIALMCNYNENIYAPYGKNNK